MEKHTNAFKVYFEKYSKKIRDCNCDNKPVIDLDYFPLLPSQALYIIDWETLAISYQRGIDVLLGYSPREFTYDLFSRFYHPDDFERYIRLLKLSNEWIREVKPKPFSVETSVDYRIQKKDGSYLKILRQSTVFESCKDKQIKSTFSILTDISRIKLNTSVNLSVICNKNGRIVLEDNEDQFNFSFLTKREKEILVKLKEGLNSKAIAQEFHISSHTVDTHRRKMLAKANCKNVMELVQQATKRGVI